MKRRWFIPAAVLAAMALALGACGGDDGGGTEEGDGSITVFSLSPRRIMGENGLASSEKSMPCASPSHSRKCRTM